MTGLLAILVLVVGLGVIYLIQKALTDEEGRLKALQEKVTKLENKDSENGQ